MFKNYLFKISGILIIQLFLVIPKLHAQYCDPLIVYGTTTGTALNRFVLGDIDNTSGAGDPYNDYTDLSTELTPGSEYTATIYNYDNGCFFAVWIDYDHDEIFDEEEKLSSEISLFGSDHEDIEFTVPETTLSGETRLRVLGSSSMGFYLEPCGDDDYYYGEAEDYTIIISATSEYDAGISAIISPVSGCGLTGSASVQTTITNYGLEDITSGSFTVKYELTDPLLGVLPVISQEYDGDDLSSFESAEFTFSSPAVFTSPGIYSLKVWTELDEDIAAFNDSSINIIENIPIINTYPYIQDFETSYPGWLSGGINNSWELGMPAGDIIAEAPPLTPDSEYSWGTSLTGNYNIDEISFITTPCFDLSSLVLPYIEFDIWWETEEHWDGANFQYSLDGGDTWTILGDVGSGENWYTWDYIFSMEFLRGWEGIGGEWKRAYQDISFLAGEPAVRFRLFFQSEDSPWYDSDGIAFDNFKISDSNTDDLSVAYLISPVAASVDYSATTDVTVTITNLGTIPQSGFNVAYNVNGGVAYSSLFAGTIDPGESADFNLSVFDFSADGIYDIKIWTELAGDMNILNDTLNMSISNTIPVSGTDAYLIYSNSTGTEPFYGTEYEDDMDEVFAGVWDQKYFEELEPLEVFNENTCFIYLAGGFDQANELEIFLNNNQIIIEAWVESGGHLIINASPGEGDGMSLGFDGVELLFPYYTFSGAAVDSTHPVFTGIYSPTLAEYLGSFVAQGKIEGDFIPIFEDPYTADTYLMGEKLWGDGRVIFASINKYMDWYTPIEGRNMHLNMIYYLKICGQVDIGATALISPVSGCGLIAENEITIKADNFGTADAGSIPVYFTVDGGTAVAGTIPFIAAGSSVEYTFPETADLSEPGFHSITIYTGYLGDVDETNDLISTGVEGLATPSIELGENFIACDEAVLDAENPGSIYDWSTGASTQELTITTSGIYSVLITHPVSGCFDSDTITATIEYFPVADFTYTIDGSDVSFTNTSEGGTSFSWNFGDGFGSTTESPYHTYENESTYIVTLTIYNSCGSDDYTTTVDLTPENIHTLSLMNNTQLYPNPATGLTTIEFNFPEPHQLSLELLNSTGEIVFSKYAGTIKNEKFEMDLSTYSSGVYSLKIITEEVSFYKDLIIVK
ncbi:MAG: T9SS type A sorting domain-containing protein [Fimbriimonadaceae bacterium]|nr:T9SS type A sorting domain-containing protein [Chitinophagales bacterium]